MFPMPKRAYVSPLLRAMQTFVHALGQSPEHPGEKRHTNDPKDIIIVQPKDSYILKKLREKKTGNCADILIDEYTSHENPIKPPRAGTKGKAPEKDEDVQQRAVELHDDICEMDDSDCIVRVTHSLLIQNNLTNLEVGGRQVLQKFMLAECGLFAYVIEGDRPEKKKAKYLRDGLKTVARRWEIMGKRRKSAFPDPEHRTTPAEVSIEQPILRTAQIDRMVRA